MSNNVRLSCIKPKDGSEGPVLVRFPSGVPPLADTELTLQKTTSKRPRLKSRRRLVAEVTDNCQFVAENFGHHASKTIDPCSYAVAVYDRKTHTLKVHPVKTTFTMSLQVHTNKVTQNDSLSQLTNRAKRQLLVNEFGSRKRKRDQKAQQATQITSDNIAGGEAVKKMLARTASDLGTSSSSRSNQELALEESRRAFLPPFDASATEPMDVYALEHLLYARRTLDHRAKIYLNFLTDASEFATAREAPRKNKLSAYLIERIADYHVEQEIPEIGMKAYSQLMAMWSYLARFHRLPHRFSGTMAELAKK